MSSPVRVIAVASGKGGVGKTTVALNLALALQLAGRRTLLMDGDLGLTNIPVMLGLEPRRTLADVLDGSCALADTLLAGPYGLAIVPASSGAVRMTQLSPLEHAGLVRAFSTLPLPLDALVVDTAAGIAPDVLTFAQAAQDVIVVLCNEPASTADAYALIKVLSGGHGVDRIRVLASMVRSEDEGPAVFARLAQVSDHFLGVTLEYAGAVPNDDAVRASIQAQRAVIEAYPDCPASRAFRQLAGRVEAWGAPDGARGNLEFFVERLVGAPVAEGAPS